MKTLTNILLSLVFLFLPVVGLTGPVGVDGEPIKLSFGEEQYQQLFKEVFEMGKALHVDETDPVKMYQGAINGFLQSLDPHSGYIPPKEHAKGEMTNKVKFFGIGAHVDPKHGVVRIVRPVTVDAPMVKAGLKADDLIVEIEVGGKMESTRTMDPKTAIDHIKGPEGTDIRLRIRRGTHLFFVTVTRARVDVPVVYAGIIGDDTIYIRLTQFTLGAADEIQEAYLRMKAMLPTQTVHNIVLDLRFNPGGLLAQAAAISDGFLDGGRLVTTIGRNNETISTFNATERLMVKNDVAVAVLINNFSASASEIVAGALQDLAAQREAPTLIVGEKSYGKGSVQSVYSLPDGGAIKITIAKYYTATGKMIHGKGITPDVEVSLKEGERLPEYSGVITKFDTQLKAALVALKEATSQHTVE